MCQVIVYVIYIVLKYIQYVCVCVCGGGGGGSKIYTVCVKCFIYIYKTYTIT